MDLKDRWWRLQNLYLIRDKNRRLVKLKFNPSQQRIQRAISPSIEAGVPIRHKDLKARQVGATTFWSLFYLDDTVFNPNTLSAIIAQKYDTLGFIWEAVRLAYSSMPDALRPASRNDNARVLAFEGTNSRISVALKIEGSGLNNGHFSEYALCKPDEIEKTIAACSPNANITFETVSEGMNHAYEKWNDSNDGYSKVFHPWFVQPEYRSNAPLTRPRTEEEQAFAAMVERRYGISIDDLQIAFRRDKQRELKKLFKSMYAEDEDTCFLASGGAYFEASKINVLLKEAEEYLKINPPFEEGPETVIYEKPQPRHVYVAGADVAGGRDNVSADRDYSVLAILCLTCRKTAMRYKARCNHDAFYRTCYRIGVEYNRALLGIERNNHGHAILLGLKELNYPNLYVQATPSTRFKKPLSELKVGWDTTAETKPVMMAQIKQALEGESEDDETNFQPQFLWLDTEFLRETFYVREEGGKIGAVEGKHDDMVIAYAIACQMARQSLSTMPSDLARIATTRRESA